jgi:hypothetical protein
MSEIALDGAINDDRAPNEQDRNGRRYKRRSCRINGEDCLSGWRGQPRVPQPPAKIRVQPSASLLTGVLLEPTLNPTASSLLTRDNKSSNQVQIVPQMSKIALDGALNEDRAGLTARTV